MAFRNYAHSNKLMYYATKMSLEAQEGIAGSMARSNDKLHVLSGFS